MSELEANVIQALRAMLALMSVLRKAEEEKLALCKETAALLDEAAHDLMSLATSAYRER